MSVNPALGRTGLIIALAASVVGCAARIVTPVPQDGRELYLSACASCHGADGTGAGPAAPALCTAPPDLTRLSQRHGAQFPRPLVIAVTAGERPVTAHGDREMPVWSQRFGPSSGATAAASIYARQRLEQLADYIESLQRTDAR